MGATRPWKKWLVFIGIGAAVAAVIAGIVVWQTRKNEPEPEPSGSELGIYENAAVSSDSPGCSEIGKQVLLENGTVADAAIATLFCMGIVQSHSMGVGGGFFMVYYNATSRTATTLNARETAPAGATEEMYGGNPELSSRGGLSVAVPGELKGYYEMWLKLGGGRDNASGISWSRLLEPTIRMCEEGFRMVRANAAAAASGRQRLMNETNGLREIFVRNGELLREGDVIYRPKLAETLRILQREPDALYTDTELMGNFVDDLRGFGGIITEDDMKNYEVIWDNNTLPTTLSNRMTIHTFPPPGSGLLLQFILRIMDGYNLTPDILQSHENSTLTFHRFVEAMKHAYARRTYMGDPYLATEAQKEQIAQLVSNLTSPSYIDEIRSMILDDITNNTYDYYGAEFYQPNDGGTAHVSIIGPNGDAISVTSTINLYFGAAIRSNRTGIIYNDEMDDFSSPNITNEFGVPPSPNNFISPGRRPVSSMAPAILVGEDGRARLVIGAAGGTQITTSTAYASMRNIFFGQNIKEAIDAPRLHHQLYGMRLSVERGFSEEITEEFQKKGHNITWMESGGSVVQGVARTENGTIFANADYRKGGVVAGY